MRARLFALTITMASVGYLILSVDRIKQFVDTGNAVGLFFAVAIAGVSLVSAILIWREIRFGISMASMAKAMAQANALPLDDLPKTADGRVVREAADARFESYKLAVEADRTKWQNWYLLAVGYDDARDRKRARGAMRTAEKLFKSR
ncbi:MAG: hypothetical protein RL441_1641 [Actinomycetota bacterium]|jgi:hypothetical protein